MPSPVMLLALQDRQIVQGYALRAFENSNTRRMHAPAMLIFEDQFVFALVGYKDGRPQGATIHLDVTIR